MEKIPSTYSTISTESNFKNSTENSTADKVGGIVELVEFHNPKFKAWYCSQVYRLGAQRFLEIAGVAKTGKNPQTLFSWLLKQAQ